MCGLWYDKGIREYIIMFYGFDIRDFFCSYEGIISGFLSWIIVNEKIELFRII